jgi:hypothetical protein
MKRFERRVVLRGFAGTLISLPILEGCTNTDGLVSLPAREVAKSQSGLSALKAKRFVALMCPNGVYPPKWFPTGADKAFTLNEHNAPLESIREHLIMTRGIANKVALDTDRVGSTRLGREQLALLGGAQRRSISGDVLCVEWVRGARSWHSLRRRRRWRPLQRIVGAGEPRSRRADQCECALRFTGCHAVGRERAPSPPKRPRRREE